jgi:Xaa-Pro aminopeptidase
MYAAGSSEHDARRDEIAGKLAAARELMASAGIGALHLATAASMAWLTGGAATSIDESSAVAAFTALVTPGDAYILTDPIEAPRLREEERLTALGFSLVEEPWHARGAALARLAAGMRLAAETQRAASDEEFWRALQWRRATFAAIEQARLRVGARLAGEAMDAAARSVRRGMVEREVAARLSAESRARGGAAIVTLVGSDERIYRYRHPLPTDRHIDSYAMLVLCFRYRGLVTALTRSVYIGELPPALLATAQAVARIDARMLAATRPGRTLAEVYALASAAYADESQPGAIDEHHQGGPIGYLSREVLATPQNDWRIAPGQAFAWNPSLRGAKSEDTILLTQEGVEVMSAVSGWPTWRVETPNGVFERPAILQLAE